MSILSNIAEGWFSYKTSSGYQKLAPRTKSTLVSMEDGTSVENKVNSVAQGNNSVSFTQAGTRQNISASDTIKTILGKISKWFADLKTVAFSGSYNDLSNKPTIVNNGTTTTTNTVLDGRMGKTLADKDTNLQSQITSINSALEIRNVHAEERFGEDANNFYGNPNAVTFFHVNVETATRNNHFPTEGYAGTLMAINLYGSHLIQVFFCMDGYIYIRTLSDYQNPSGSNFTQWRKI